MNITDAMIKKICSSMIYKRGCEYFGEGRVHMRKRSETELSAVVDEDELYNVYISLSENGVNNFLCTCPYYETMQTPCKHIVAVLKHRQSELEDGDRFDNENDKIASELCNIFADTTEKEIIHASFILYIRSASDNNPIYEMSVVLPEYGGVVQGVENFLDCHINSKDFKLERGVSYNSRRMYFPADEEKIISILAEVYETRSSEIMIYQKASYRTVFGQTVARRIFPLLENVDFKVIYDGLNVNGARIKEDNPDIIIDIETYGTEIILSVSEKGFALTSDGEWFFHNDIIYHTEKEWREYFMPVYRSLSREGRTQISFCGENAMLFATHVLPELRNRRGVAITGVDELIVNEKPEFEIYLDIIGTIITAFVIVSYGGIKFRIPDIKTEYSDKIVLRDYEKETEMLSFFDGFERERNLFLLKTDEEIYRFITISLPIIEKNARVVMTSAFKKISVRDDFDMSFNVSYREKTDLLEIGFETDLSDEEINGIIQSLKLRQDFYRMADGGFLNLSSNRKAELLKFLDRIELNEQDIIYRSKQLPKFHMLYLENMDDVSKDESIRNYMQKVRQMEVKIPRGLENVLRNYQCEGIKWFTQLSAMNMGGVLADDMGLGKTLQVIAFIHGIKPEKPVLIAAPSALVYNWQREIEKFTPDASSLVVSGSKEQRAELLKTAGEYEFIITSYPMLRRDIALYTDIDFSYFFIDEAQYIKNYKTMNAVSVKKIKADHKFALTGTPIENSLMELWSIFDFVMPGYLKTSRQFREKFEYPAMRDGDGTVANMLRNIIRPFVMRRMKNDVLNELPEKIETIMLAQMNDKQKVMYSVYLESAKNQARGILTQNGNKLDLLTLLLRLRQICCHPSLFKTGTADMESGKLDLLMELIKSGLGSKHRILVFSQFRSMLDIIKGELKKNEIDYFYINGSTPPQERTQMAERFNGGEGDVFLVSLKAGGTGLNLVGADTVIHYDPWWNPAVTDQATDRAYRIGQTKAVQVIKLAAKGTIEEKILELQDKKRMLAEDIIRVNNKTFSSLSDEEVMSLFDL